MLMIEDLSLGSTIERFQDSLNSDNLGTRPLTCRTCGNITDSNYSMRLDSKWNIPNVLENLPGPFSKRMTAMMSEFRVDTIIRTKALHTLHGQCQLM